MSGTDYDNVVLKIHSYLIYYQTLQSYGKVARLVSFSCFCFRKFGGVSGMVRKIAVILEFKYTECLQSYLLFIALYLLLGTEC